MIFDEVNIKLIGKKISKENKVIKHQPIDDFVGHMNKYFSHFVKDFPIFNELKRLGKITAVVKWIHDNQIPIDTSLFEEYKVKRCHTPLMTPNINQTKPKGEQAFWMSGGVSYELDETNYFQTTHANAETIQNAMINARPSEVVFEWDFESFDKKLNKNTSYKAVAHTFSKTQKDGNLKQQLIDICLPVRGDLKLAFIRYYDSFNDRDNGLGRGWEITPFSLYFPSKKALMRFNPTGKQLDCYPNIIVRSGDSEEEYRLCGLEEGLRPIYMSRDGAYQLIENSGGNFVLFRKNLGKLVFGKLGKLLRIIDNRGIELKYFYEGDRLIEIAHQDGRKIDLHYNDERLVKVVGPGNKTINFECNPIGLLISSSEGKSKTLYKYDSQQHLCSMVAPKGNLIFEADYDDYHRVKEISDGKGLSFKKEYMLAKKRSKTTMQDGRTSIIQYDNHNRVVKQIDSMGNSINFAYREGLKFGKPLFITNKLGHVEENHYDQAGNLSYRKNANGEEWHFLWDEDNQLIGVKNPSGWGEYYVYDQGKLTHCYHYANLKLDQNGKLTGQIEYYMDYVTRYDYDQQTGDLLSITDAEGVEKKFFYDENGLPIRMGVSEECFVENSYDNRSRLRKKQMGKRLYTYQYDQLDRLAKVSSSSGEISYDYDFNGNIIAIHDQKGNPTAFEYNERDDLVKVTDAEGGELLCEYNEFGQLKKMTYPNHLIQEVEYDPLNRTSKQIFKF